MKQRFLQVFILVFVFVFLAACENKIDSNMSEEVAEFEYITQDNESLSTADLEDKWLVANFMYTNCTIVCPTTTPNMANVQDELQKSNLNAEFVSFSVDPEVDAPEVLKNYAEEYKVDLSNWSFLSGYSFEEIQDLSNNYFNTALEGGGPEEHEFVHSTNFF